MGVDMNDWEADGSQNQAQPLPQTQQAQLNQSQELEQPNYKQQISNNSQY